MTFCTRCGAELPEGALACPRCGAPTQATWQPSAVTRVPPTPRSEFDILGAVSAGGILIILALTWLVYPNLFSILVDYFRSFEVYRGPVMPPYALGQPIMFFLDGIGIWGIVIGGLRFALMHFPRKAVGNIMNGIFWLIISYLLSEFYRGHIHGSTLIAAAIIALGILVIVGMILRVATRPYLGPRET